MSVVAQRVETRREINVVYLAHTNQQERAIETIETASTVGSGAVVSYRAGQSIVLMPSFNAHAGSVFSASIEPVSVADESGMRLAIAPNPVGTNSIINYSLPTEGDVSLVLVDQKGNVIREFVKETKTSGVYRHNLDSSQLATGVYVCTLYLGNQHLSVRVIKQ